MLKRKYGTVMLMVVQESSARIAVIHDSQWISMLEMLGKVRIDFFVGPGFHHVDAGSVMEA